MRSARYADLLGSRWSTIDWGAGNTVEGGNYLGIVTWLLAAVAVVLQPYGQ